jgi:uncharacterized membrane protein YraQ (UPF0718 family)
MEMYYYLYIVAGVALLVSFLVNREKTLKAVKVAAKRFVNILPAFLTMIILVSIALFLVPDEVISNYLGGSNKFIGVLFASFFGSVTLVPGFIAYPLCGILLKKGVAYMVLAVFATTLMMVGVLTYPIEKRYFGTKVTIIRNVISFFIALIVAVMIGIFFGEIFSEPK